MILRVIVTEESRPLDGGLEPVQGFSLVPVERRQSAARIEIRRPPAFTKSETCRLLSGER
jgi:hypothetical protein